MNDEKERQNTREQKSTISKDEVLNSLKNCYDPEIPINIVDLGLIYALDIGKDGVVSVKMTLTAIGCPVGDLLAEEVKSELLKIKNVKDVIVEIVWDPPWTPEKMSDDARRTLGI
jgi:FeS assembly SUF system protein